jgi:hypothetical protein
MGLRTLIELKASAPGLPGPYLQENLAPYREIDALETNKLQVMTVIGGLQKRKTILRYFGLSRQSAAEYSVALGPRPGNSNIIFLDCELHLQPDSSMKKINGGYQPGHLRYHLLQQPVDTAHDLAYSLYYNALSLFSDIIVLFVSDIGGLERVIDILCYWIREGIEKHHQHQTCILLVFGSSNEIRDEIVMGRLEVAMLHQLRTTNAKTSYTWTQIHQIQKRLFNIDIVRQTENFVGAIDRALLRSTVYRAETGLHFAPVNWKFLFQEAMAQYGAQKGSRFDLISASRLHNPIPRYLSDCLIDVFKSCEDNRELPYIIASALAMDAFPPLMHRKYKQFISAAIDTNATAAFPSDRVFESLYVEAVDRCEKIVNIPYFTLRVKLLFSSLVSQARKQGNDTIRQHLEIIQSTNFLSGTFTQTACSLCLIQLARYTLDCKHRICGSCVLLFSDELEPWRFKHTSCRVCHNNNTRVIVMKPPTAGDRILHLSGTVPERVLSFLKELQIMTGLNGMPFCEHFDILHSTELGK